MLVEVVVGEIVVNNSAETSGFFCTSVGQQSNKEALNRNANYICWICEEELISEELLSNHYKDHIARLPWP